VGIAPTEIAAFHGAQYFDHTRYGQTRGQHGTEAPLHQAERGSGNDEKDKWEISVYLRVHKLESLFPYY
jgi:hypothetical protein